MRAPTSIEKYSYSEHRLIAKPSYTDLASELQITVLLKSPGLSAIGIHVTFQNPLPTLGVSGLLTAP